MQKIKRVTKPIKPIGLFKIGSAAVIFLSSFNSAQAGAPVCHVSADGSGNGTSWSAAAELTSALADVNCAEIWVKTGTYYPTDNNDVSISFVIDRTMKLYGGFAGDETNLNQRVPGQYPSILSGNIGDQSEVDDNSDHVVYVDGSTANGPITDGTEIDGFTISHGFSNYNHGGGMFCDGNGIGSECSPTLNHINFFENAAYGGGALYNDGDNGGVSNPLVLNSTFAYNLASFAGAAFYSQAYAGTSSPTFYNVTFYENHSEIVGGVMYSKSFQGDSSPTFINSTFYGNSSEQRGGVFAIASTTSRPSYFTVINSIIWANTAVKGFPVVMNESARGEFLNSVIDVECPTYVGVQYTCADIITTDPMMGQLKDNGGFTLTSMPYPQSSVIDSALSEHCIDDDQRGVMRPQGLGCDIGAVEMRVSDEVIFKHGFENEVGDDLID